MKLRTSYFDTAILKKNITRFAPAWGLYSAFLLMVFMVILDSDQESIWTASNLCESTSFMVVANCIYGFVAAQMLWGDLFNSRMCNALHALPLRREGWFLTGTAAGLLFALVPNLVFALGMMPFCGEHWSVALLWLAASIMQYLCFFGLATLSAFLVGNRFAMGLVYGIVNFISLIIYWLLDALYLPSMGGIVLRSEHFLSFSPVVQMAENYDMFDVEWQKLDGMIRNVQLVIGEGWGYAGICAGIGLLALVLALLIYRKRHLECAGDLVAVKPLAPVVLVLYTLCVTALCYGFLSLFMGSVADGYAIFGLFIGFFTGKMLLERQVRVFRKKNLLGFVAVVLLFFGSMAMAACDVLGVVKWVPDADDVASVSISTGGSYYYQENGITLEAKEDIEKILYVHEEGLAQNWELEGNTVRLNLTYEMESGMRRSREYSIEVASEAGQILKDYLSSPEAVLKELAYYGNFTMVELHDPGVQISDPQALAALRDAILADCAAGTMAQDWNFYPDAEEVHYMSLEFNTPEGIHYYRELRFWDRCVNIMAWVEDTGLVFEKWD